MIQELTMKWVGFLEGKSNIVGLGSCFLGIWENFGCGCLRRYCFLSLENGGGLVWDEIFESCWDW